MPRGPLPNPQRRRTNAPTIPTTELPAGGRKGPIPRPPKWIDLGEAGSAWWRWAWRTPESAAWSTGSLVAVARRASLEDDLATVSRVESVDLDELVGQLDPVVKQIISCLASLAVGRLQIMAKMLDLDTHLGLTTKSAAALRFAVVAEAELVVAATGVPNLDDRRQRLSSAS